MHLHKLITHLRTHDLRGTWPASQAACDIYLESLSEIAQLAVGREMIRAQHPQPVEGALRGSCRWHQDTARAAATLWIQVDLPPVGPRAEPWVVPCGDEFDQRPWMSATAFRKKKSQRLTDGQRKARKKKKKMKKKKKKKKMKKMKMKKKKMPQLPLSHRTALPGPAAATGRAAPPSLAAAPPIVRNTRNLACRRDQKFAHLPPRPGSG